MKRDIVTIGASRGGIEALMKLLPKLPEDFPASIFVTIHTMPVGDGLLPDVLGSISSLPVKSPQDQEEIRPGVVYVASPNLHLIVRRGHIRNRFLPKENGTRPSIDPMFRSAAHAYSRRVIGVLLSGDLDDGTAGLGVIKDEGGLTIVQDPKSAAHPDMPLSAINTIDPNYVVPLDEIAPLLVKLVNSGVKEEAPTELTETKEMEHVITCPNCGGVLTEYASDKVIWFQCKVGHRFTSESMITEQSRVIEEHFWRILALLKEKEESLRTMASDARATVTSLVDPEFFEKQAQAAVNAQNQIQDLLDNLGPILFPGLPKKDPSKAEGKENNKSEKSEIEKGKRNSPKSAKKVSPTADKSIKKQR